MAHALRGTTAEQDGRWGKSDANLIAKMTKEGKFAPILDTRVDLKKVNLDIISKWVQAKVTEILGFEDEIIINLVVNMLNSEKLEGKMLQLNVTGFLEKQAGAFCTELWTLLVDAQSQPTGIPSTFIQQKKAEILRRDTASSATASSQAVLSDANSHPATAGKDSSSTRPGATSESTRRRGRSPSPDRPRSRRSGDRNERRRSGERSSRNDHRDDHRRRFSPDRQSRSPLGRRSDRRDRSRSRENRGSRYRDYRRSDHRRDGSRSRSRSRNRNRSRSQSPIRKRSDSRQDNARPRDRSVDRKREDRSENYRGRRRSRSISPSRSSSPSPRTSRRQFHSPSRTPSIDNEKSDVKQKKHKKDKKEKKKSKSKSSRRSPSSSSESIDRAKDKDTKESGNLQPPTSESASRDVNVTCETSNEDREHHLREMALKSILLARQQKPASAEEEA